MRLYNSAGVNVQTVLAEFGNLGNYTFTGLAAGTYYVVASGYDASTGGNPWIAEVYNNIQCVVCAPLTGTGVPVGATGINFNLEIGGQIAGFVFSGGVPVENLNLRVYDSNGTQLKTGQTAQSFEVGGAGSYRIGNLPSGFYRLRTITTFDFFSGETLNFFNKAYDDDDCHPTCAADVGDLIQVTAGSATEGINFNLVAGGKIQGTVTGAGGAPLSGVTIQVYSGTTQVATTTTNASGAYSATQLTTGPHFVRTAVPAGLNNYVDELYNNLPCVGCSVTTGTPVNVTLGAVTPGINFALELGGAVTGQVTNASGGAALASIAVRVITASGATVKSANTNASGNYTIPGLPVGAYYVRTAVSAAQNYVDELYNNVVCLATCPTADATAVSVTTGNTTAGINFALSPGGSVTGTVTDGSAGVGSITMGAYTADGVLAKSASSTAGTGAYTIIGLPSGSYFIRATPGATSNLIGEVYNNFTCVGCTVTTGTPVTVTTGLAASGIDFALALGGSVTGTVTSEVGALPLQNVSVVIYDSTGASRKSGSTSASGTFSVPGLPAGFYYVRATTGATSGYADELHNNISFMAGDVRIGTQVQVFVDTATTVNFALPPAAIVTGTVVDASTLVPLGNLAVRAYNNAGFLVRQASTDLSGNYSLGGLAAGTYFVRTVSNSGYSDVLFNGLQCLGNCTVTNGSGIIVQAGDTVPNVNFALAGGGRVAGTITETGTGVPISGVVMRLYSEAGTPVAAGTTDTAGAYITSPGVPNGIYFARTFNTAGFTDEIYDIGTLCLPNCLVTSGTAIGVTPGMTTAGVNLDLLPKTETVQNGSFASGTTGWSLFATPTQQYMEYGAGGAAFSFARVAPPPGTTNQAVIFQNTGIAFSSGTPLLAQFDLANSSAVRKRVSVLVHDADFLDLAVCTFWLPPSSSLTRYGMRTRTTKAWANATISIYAASTNNPSGLYSLDNVSVQELPGAQVLRTDCLDPTVPAPPGGPNGPNLLVNGNFASGALLPGWGTFGNVQTQVAGGVLEFIKLAGSPAGVVLQATGQAVPANTLITSTFQVGNSSPNRQRFTVIMHDLDFSDLSACTFWVNSGQALSTYSYRAFTTKAIANLTLSIYPATTNGGQWLRLDNATMAVTPGAPINGAECVEPGSTVP